MTDPWWLAWRDVPQLAAWDVSDPSAAAAMPPISPGVMTATFSAQSTSLGPVAAAGAASLGANGGEREEGGGGCERSSPGAGETPPQASMERLRLRRDSATGEIPPQASMPTVRAGALDRGGLGPGGEPARFWATLESIPLRAGSVPSGSLSIDSRVRSMRDVTGSLPPPRTPSPVSRCRSCPLDPPRDRPSTWPKQATPPLRASFDWVRYAGSAGGGLPAQGTAEADLQSTAVGAEDAAAQQRAGQEVAFGGAGQGPVVGRWTRGGSWRAGSEPAVAGASAGVGAVSGGTGGGVGIGSPAAYGSTNGVLAAGPQALAQPVTCTRAHVPRCLSSLYAFISTRTGQCPAHTHFIWDMWV